MSFDLTSPITVVVPCTTRTADTCSCSSQHHEELMQEEWHAPWCECQVCQEQRQWQAEEQHQSQLARQERRRLGW